MKEISSAELQARLGYVSPRQRPKPAPPTRPKWVPSKLPDRIAVKLQRLANGCWEWKGGRNDAGYGYVSVIREGAKRQLRAHRAVYELIVGPIPNGLHLDHLCRNRACCNPVHLEPVTPAENTRRGLTGEYHLRKTHCPSGHEYDEANTMYRRTRNGFTRKCRICLKAQMHAEFEKRKLKEGKFWTKYNERRIMAKSVQAETEHPIQQ